MRIRGLSVDSLDSNQSLNIRSCLFRRFCERIHRSMRPLSFVLAGGSRLGVFVSRRPRHAIMTSVDIRQQKNSACLRQTVNAQVVAFCSCRSDNQSGIRFCICGLKNPNKNWQIIGDGCQQQSSTEYWQQFVCAHADGLAQQHCGIRTTTTTSRRHARLH